MENLNFVLGILSTVGAFLLGYASVGMFKVKKQVSDIFTSITEVYRCLDDTHTAISGEIEREQQSVQVRMDEIYRQMDSRFDKLENKLTK